MSISQLSRRHRSGPFIRRARCLLLLCRKVADLQIGVDRCVRTITAVREDVLVLCPRGAYRKYDGRCAWQTCQDLTMDTQPAGQHLLFCLEGMPPWLAHNGCPDGLDTDATVLY